MTVPNGFKPQLAVQHDKVKQIAYPLSVSPKIDGLRCVVFDGVAYSRSLKPIPNKHIQQWAKDNADLLQSLDGELVVGEAVGNDVFNRSQSGCMRIDGEPEFTFWVFDCYSELPYRSRYNYLRYDLDKIPNTQVVEHWVVFSEQELTAKEQEYLAEGYEGLMANNPFAFYKTGRAGTKTPELIKFKQFSDCELLCIGYEPLYKNTNEAKLDELGRTDRSTSKEGLIAQELLGALVLLQADGSVLRCGSGFNAKQRKELWEQREELAGKLVTVKHFEQGAKDVLRFPIFKGFRSKLDLS